MTSLHHHQLSEGHQKLKRHNWGAPLPPPIYRSRISLQQPEKSSVQYFVHTKKKTAIIILSRVKNAALKNTWVLEKSLDKDQKNVPRMNINSILGEALNKDTKLQDLLLSSDTVASVNCNSRAEIGAENRLVW